MPNDFTKYGNLLLITAISSVLLMMVVPLPPGLLDFFLAINIMVSVTLVVLAVFMTEPMKLASFPTLLLITTLFRLGLNLSSTRLILSTGDAGHIIETFGRFATGGNLLVGFIMFIILTLIQFIVISKGSERVAEVAARFTLDALPGKQMSIDADLRAGLLTQEEAKVQRESLHRESKLYGSMDGAMKFVKGDAIAGLLITVINLLGGVVTGCLIQEMELAEAAYRYSILTIGDSLVSQIPSFLVSMTAGFIVTRVHDSKHPIALGTDILQQVTSQPQALLVAGGLSFLMGLIPGMPTMAFWALAAILSISGAAIILMAKKILQAPPALESYLISPEKWAHHPINLAVPLSIEVGPEIYRVFGQDPRWVRCFDKLYPRLKLHLTHRQGVMFPDIKISICTTLTSSNRYRIKIYEVPVDEGLLTPQACSYIGPSGQFEDLESPATTSETVHGTKLLQWHLDQQKNLDQKGIPTFGPEEMLLRQLAKTLVKHASEFIGIQEVRHMLTLVEGEFADLVREVVPKMMSIQKLTDIVKRLVEEEVSIKDFRLILQILANSQPEGKDPVTLTEMIRIGLKRHITYKYSRGNQLAVVTLDPEIEDEISKSIHKNGTECYLAMEPRRMELMMEAFKNTFDTQAIDPATCVILTNLEIRRYLKKMLESVFPNLPVLSYQELDPQVSLKSLGQVVAIQ